jgi:hypothetical protein
MSHEYQDRDLPITYIETDYGYDYSYDNENGFLYIAPIPEFFTKEFKGLYYEGVSYSWDEIDYRMGVEYSPSVPEPSSFGLFIGIAVLSFLTINKLRRK